MTPTGFDKLTSIVPNVLNSSLGGGFCMGRGSFGDPSSCNGLELNTGAEWCYSNANGCSPGCKATVGLNPGGFELSQVSANVMNMRISANLSMPFTLRGRALCVSLGSCTMTVTSNNLAGDLDVRLGTRADNGELVLELDRINQFQLNMNFQGCGILSDIGNLATTIIDSFVGQFVISLLTPAVNNLLQGFLPNPLGIANMIDIGSLMGGISPGTDGFMEARIVPGGYANLSGGGLNLGVITALNADEDPSTRGALASEPHLCVPPLGQPSFAGLGLGSIYRSAFGGNTNTLAAAGEFSGNPNPPAVNGQAVDIAMGISETTLDLTGHHLVTSGGMCLGVGTNLIAQLNVGTIGLLVPSLGELASDEGNDPLLLVTRPQRAVDFTIGDNTTASPGLTIHLKNMEVDFYAFIWERYVRAFTLDLTMNVGINLQFEQQATGTVIKPELVGLSASEVTVKVLNSQFVRETPQQLEMVLPSVFNLVTSIGALPDIPVPSFGGLSVNPLKIQKVTTSQDDFLALYAQLGSSPMMRAAAQDDFGMAEIVAKMDAGFGPVAPSTGRATLVDVDTPAPELIRDALMNKDGALPSITFDVERFDAQGRELEWTWNINGGLWHPYSTQSPLVITDKAFAWQGKYEIELKSRVKGNARTVSEVIRQKVVIDSAGPRIFEDKVAWDDGLMAVTGWDIVGGRDFEVAFGELGANAPATKWVPYREAKLARASAETLVKDHNGMLAVWARDELGNQTIAYVAPFHGQAGESGCNCETSSRPGIGGLILMGLVGFGMLRRRRRTQWMKHVVRVASSRAARNVALFVGVVALSSLVPACSCGENQAQSCETSEDCSPDACDPGQLPFCIDNTCVCSDDIPAGRIGPYSDVGTGAGQIWVSAYASSHGDLVVANATGGRIPTESWEWVDGVPDGPVVVPGSTVRGGIEDSGPDVGMYTSIAVANDGTPMVSYFDRSTASLKFATRAGGVWTTHIVQQGTSQIDPGSGGGTLVGMYTSLTLRTDDGRPGIAYLAHVADAQGERAEVRYAAAQSANPASSADWTFWTVDTAPIPDNPDDIYPLPGGLGLFVDSARNPMNQAPVVVYYDRSNGDLKIARFNASSGQFATPVILDGSNGVDAGWSPAVQVDAQGVAHVTYVSASGDDLTYTTDAANAPKEIVDNGYRIVGTTVDGLPKPEFHFVGDDANLILPPGGEPIVVYQDATTQELLVAQKGQDGKWNRVSIAGATEPWTGAYGFFASAALGTQDVVMSSWVINQPESDNWVEVFSKPFVIQ